MTSEEKKWPISVVLVRRMSKGAYRFWLPAKYGQHILDYQGGSLTVTVTDDSLILKKKPKEEEE